MTITVCLGSECYYRRIRYALGIFSYHLVNGAEAKSRIDQPIGALRMLKATIYAHCAEQLSVAKRGRFREHFGPSSYSAELRH